MALLTDISVTINRKPLKNFRKISISQNLYGIDRFEISCRYDALENLDGFMIEKSKDFLGLPILIQTKVKVQDEEKDGLSFRGFVTEIHSTRSGLADYDQVIISGGSSEIILNRKPVNRAFIDKTLDEIVKEVLKKYELKPNVSSRNKSRFPYIVQFEESDLEFLKRLSMRYGEWCFFNGDEFIFGELPDNEKTLTVGSNLKDFSYELRVSPVKFKLFSVDPLKIDVHNYTSGNSKLETNLNIYGKHALDRSLKMYPEEGNDYYEHLNVNETDYKKGLDQVGETEEASDLVNLSEMTGTSTNGFLAAGVQVKVSCPKKNGKDKLDYGKYIITSVNHEMDNTFAYSNNFSAIPAETSIPENTNPYFVRTSSNQLGMIEDNDDPKKLGRVKVSFWWMAGKQTTPWIKVTTPYVHKKAGFYFVPAKNARVLVGFEDGDVEKPYCLGTLYDEDANPDPDWAGSGTKGNSLIHAIRTASGNTIEFHDSGDSEKIHIYDAGSKNEIILDSGNGELRIKGTGKLSLEANNIEIKAEKELKIEAGKKMELKANQLQTEAQSDCNISGSNVTIKANAALKAEGSATAEISAGGNLTVKGALVQIN
jgi:uncharacterized protein involved in type VI secretion and phage assembly